MIDATAWTSVTSLQLAVSWFMYYLSWGFFSVGGDKGRIHRSSPAVSICFMGSRSDLPPHILSSSTSGSVFQLKPALTSSQCFPSEWSAPPKGRKCGMCCSTPRRLYNALDFDRKTKCERDAHSEVTPREKEKRKYVPSNVNGTAAKPLGIVQIIKI